MTAAESAEPRVTIGIPVFERLEYLPEALASVEAQDYPEIELLVSDNGKNGPELREIVEEHYDRPFRMRRNEEIEPVMSRHFNQIVDAASGDYFVLLCDDDYISPSFASELVAILESDPEIRLALPHVALVDKDGEVDPRDDVERLPEVLTGEELVRIWNRGGTSLWNFVTSMARTDEIEEVGGYPPMPTGDEDALVLKLTLGHKAGFSPDAVFYNRWYEESWGLSISPWELAEDIENWLEFLDTDPVLARYAEEHPDRWPEVRRRMRAKAWQTYRHRWKSMYRQRMDFLPWLRAGFALPFIPEYYRWLAGYMLRRSLAAPRRLLGG